MMRRQCRAALAGRLLGPSGGWLDLFYTMLLRTTSVVQRRNTPRTTSRQIKKEFIDPVPPAALVGAFSALLPSEPSPVVPLSLFSLFRSEPSSRSSSVPSSLADVSSLAGCPAARKTLSSCNQASRPAG